MNPTLIGVLIALLGSSMANSMPLSCPEVDDMEPCTCLRVAYGLHILCENFNSSTTLTKAFRILRDYRVHNILLHGLYLSDAVPTDLFVGIHVKELRIEKSSMIFSQLAFSGLDASLNVLNVAQHTSIKSQEGFSLARLTKLTELNVQSNSLESINDEWLNDKVPNVHTLVLDDDRIKDVSSNAFSKLKELEVFSMAVNSVSHIERSMFPRPAEHLKRLDFSSNKITELPFDIFDEMPHLKEVVLSNNKLRTLDVQTWAHVWSKLEQVMLLNNDLDCDKNMDWMMSRTRPFQLEGSCEQPADRKGLSLKDTFT